MARTGCWCRRPTVSAATSFRRSTASEPRASRTSTRSGNRGVQSARWALSRTSPTAAWARSRASPPASSRRRSSTIRRVARAGPFTATGCGTKQPTMSLADGQATRARQPGPWPGVSTVPVGWRRGTCQAAHIVFLIALKSGRKYQRKHLQRALRRLRLRGWIRALF